MRFSELQYDRIYAMNISESGPVGGMVDRSEIDPDAVGEIRERGTRWYGRDKNHFAIVASVTVGMSEGRSSSSMTARA